MSDDPSNRTPANDNPDGDTQNAGSAEISDLGGLLTKDVVLPLRIKFQIKDVCEIVVGASVLAIPVAYTEEVWNLGEQLPLPNIIAVVVTSVSFVALFVYYFYYQGKLYENFAQYLLRVVASYGITLLVVAIILGMFEKMPWQSDPAIALRRMILVGFPACFSATVVDSLK